MADDEDPLEGLYMSRDDFNRQRVFDTLSGIIGIDEDSGDPIYLDPYFELSNKERFVAQLLYRRAATSLGELDEEEEGASAALYAETLDASQSAVRNYSSEFQFVESDDERGGYVIASYSVGVAIQYLEADE